MKLILLAIFALSIFVVNEAFAEPIDDLPIIDSLIANSDGTHTLTWSAPTSDDYDIIDYDIRYAESFRYFWLENLSTDKTTVTISNLDTTKKYQFVVYAWTEHYSFASPFFYVIPAEPPVPTVDPVPTVTPTPEPITLTETKKKNKGSDSNDQPPWLGIDKDGKVRVESGVIINNTPIDAANFHTTAIIPDTKLGKVNYITLTYWDVKGPTNIKLVHLCSLKEIGTPLGESQWCIEVNIDNFKDDVTNPKIGKIVKVDKDNVIELVNVSLFLTKCMGASNADNDCLQTSFAYKYNKVPDSPVLASSAINYQNQTWNNYFNDGLTVIDPSPEPEIVITPYEYTCDDPVQKVMTRNHCDFADLIVSEANRALELLK